MSVTPRQGQRAGRTHLAGSGRNPWRYRLHRAGIRNVWQYDDAVFLFGEGRLLLRGKNGAGKSKALEMLLPFLLDGDSRALDATGTGRTSLTWLMLDGAETTNRLGYLWLELRRTPQPDEAAATDAPDGLEPGDVKPGDVEPGDVEPGDVEPGDQAEYLTLGAAVRASRTTNEARPLFFVTPRRVGRDLVLADGRELLPVDGLRAQLGEASTFATAREYRARVARDVFGLADTGRYRNLVHLLHRLRRPTVGDRVEAGGLAGLLGEALPPIDEDTVDDVAHNLDDLDAVRAELARLVRTDDALRAFLGAYRGYLHGVLRRRAGTITANLDELRARRRAAGDAERAVAAAETTVTDTENSLAGLREAERLADADLRALRDSAEYRSLRELRDRRQVVTALDRTAQAHRRSARTAAELAASAGARLHDDTDRIVTELRRLGRSHTALVRAAAEAGVDAALLGPAPQSPVHRLTPAVSRVESEVVRADAADLLRRLRDVGLAVAGRQRAAADLREALRVAAATRARAETAAQVADTAEVRAEGARSRRELAVEDLHTVSADYAAAVAAWCADPRLTREQGIDTTPLLDAVAAPTEEDPLGPAAGRSPAGAPRRDLPAEVERLADGLLIDVLRTADAERDAAVTAARGRERELGETREQRHRVLAERDPAPPRSRYREHDRDPATGAPLYLLVDFADGLDLAERAGLEAALEASGLLDGWLAADGALLDPLTRDTILTAATAPGVGTAPVVGPPAGPVAGAAARTLADVLRPAAIPPADRSSPPVPAATIAALLATVTLVPAGAASGPHTGRPRTGGTSSSTSGWTASWVSTDGRWGLGVASGAHHKPSAEYVGAGVRAETRRRILAELADRLIALEAELATAREAVEEATARRDGLRALRGALPRTTAFDQAWTALDLADAAADTAARELAQARRDAQRATAEAAQARQQADTAARAADLPADRDRLDEVITRLRELDTGLGQLRAGLADVPSLTGGHPGLVEAFAERQAEAETAAEVAQAALDQHQEAQHELTQRESAIGATEQDLLAREADATARHGRAREAIPAAQRGAQQARDDFVRSQTHRDQTIKTRTAQEQQVIGSGQALRAALLFDGLTTAAGIDLPPVLSDDDLAPDDVRGRLRRLEELTRAVTDQLAAARTDVSDSLILRRAQELGAALPGGLDAPVGERDGVKMVEVVDEVGAHPVAAFAHRIAAELVEARTRLSDREQEVFRRFLLGELGDSLTHQLTAARELVADMNRVLAEVRSSHGIGVRLVWDIRGEASPDVQAAADLLGVPAGLRTPAAAERLRGALARLIETERSDDPTAGYAAHLRKALDYRAWHEFDVRVTDAFGRERRLGPRTGLSQGEQRVVSYLVLFAAAAAHFTSLAQNEPRVPRMILLDDAFAKVDEPTHAKLLELLVDLDLDFVLTSERLWGTAPAVPSLHIYECLRDPLVRGVATLHYEWNGQRMHLVAP